MSAAFVSALAGVWVVRAAALTITGTDARQAIVLKKVLRLILKFPEALCLKCVT